MNPTAEWFAFRITDENKNELAAEFDPSDVMSASNLPGVPRTFEPGYIAIIRLISATDPFVKSLGSRFHSVWIATWNEFDDKFVIEGTHPIYHNRLKIRLK
jgi:hypothetical protein